MKNNIHNCNSLIYHTEIPITLYGEDSLPTASNKRKSYKYDKPAEESRSNKKTKLKVDIHELLKKRFTNEIWKVNPYIFFRDLASFCNLHTSELSKDNKVYTLGNFQFYSGPNQKKTHCKATYQEEEHMLYKQDKSIKKPDQVQAVSTGENEK